MDLAGTLVHIERFLDEMHPFTEHTVMDNDVRCVSGHEKHFYSWSNGFSGSEESKKNRGIVRRL
jgi:hypothetical protein